MSQKARPAPSRKTGLGRRSPCSPSGGHGANTIAPRRGACSVIDGEPRSISVVHCAQHGRLHQSLRRWRTSTMRRIATPRFYIRQSSASGDVPKQPLSRTYGTGGGPGGIAFSDSAPGGFRFLSPCRKEQRHSKELLGNVYNSIMYGTVTRWLPQSLRDSSLPEGASVHRHVADPYRLRETPSVIR